MSAVTTSAGEAEVLRAQVTALQQQVVALRRIARAAQELTCDCKDRLDYFEVPSHVMAALALALDEGSRASEVAA